MKPGSLKLPQVSGRRLFRLFTRLGYKTIQQRGSHIQMKKRTRLGTHRITVVVHQTLAKGTLHDVLSRVGKNNNLSRAELLKML
ncbi:MAG: type II toxin-antitoxin system HicA family toxin [Candidatus Latescibacteria bacterium]|nr:type II toxin-antitoxin system HicA family toxin [Candidatus Latescibacterota bacterium]